MGSEKRIWDEVVRAMLWGALGYVVARLGLEMKALARRSRVELGILLAKRPTRSNRRLQVYCGVMSLDDFWAPLIALTASEARRSVRAARRVAVESCRAERHAAIADRATARATTASRGIACLDRMSSHRSQLLVHAAAEQAAATLPQSDSLLSDTDVFPEI